MSFDKYSSPSILAKLSLCSERNENGKQPKVPVPPSISNILHSMTMGIEKLYSDISANRKWAVLQPCVKSSPFGGQYRSHTPSAATVVRPVATYGGHHGYNSAQQQRTSIGSGQQYYTDESGFLQTVDNSAFSPLISKRFKVICAMGQGSFSQVFEVEDTFLRNKPLVLKLIRRGCEVLGRREKVFLEHLDEECRKGVNCFVRCLGWLQFAEHMGLLLPLYSHTLLNYIYNPEETVNVVSEPLADHQVTLLQPKARHGLSGAIQPSSASTSSRPNLIPSPIIPPATMGLQSSRVEPTLRTLVNEDIGALRKVALSLLSAIFILHKEGIIHGDIKPENIFVDAPESMNEQYPEDVNILNKAEEAAFDQPNIGFDQSAQSYGKQLRLLPNKCAIKLGDFGNSIHVSEVKDYFSEFEIQSLPYRAPEVLIGLPFGFPIDIWSLGIMFIELCINKPLFIPKSRPEAVRGIEQRIGKLDRVRFSGGMYSHVLFETSNPIASISPSKQSLLNKADHIKSIKRLLSKSVMFGAPNYDVAEMMDFIGQMVIVDPNYRFTAKDLLQHSFVTSLLPIPYSMLSFTNSSGSESAASKKRKLQGTPFHSLNKQCEVGRSMKSLITVNESKESYGGEYHFRR